MSQPSIDGQHMIRKHGVYEAERLAREAWTTAVDGDDRTAEWHSKAILSFIEGYRTVLNGEFGGASYMGVSAQVWSPGGHNAQMVTALLIHALLANGAATGTHRGGAMVRLEKHWVSVEPGGTIEVGAYEG